MMPADEPNAELAATARPPCPLAAHLQHPADALNSPGGQVTPEMEAILRIIARENLVLATGHVHPAEIIAVVKRGRELGVRNMLITHGFTNVPGLTMAQAKEVTDLGALIAGALASLGGVYLALDQHQFTDSMTAGRGFIALAAVIFGNWRPKRVAAACLLFAAAEAFQIQLQGLQLIPSQFVEMIPYLLTIVALAGLVGRAAPPSALGKAGA